MKILVSLISEQSIPNILVIKSLPRDYRYLFVCSQQMKDSGRLAWICDVCQIDSYDEVCILEHDFVDVYAKTKDALSLYPLDSTYLVNITGGTKIMVLSIYDLLKYYPAQVLYLPPYASAAYLIYPTNIPAFLPITHSMNAIEYLKAYGINSTYEAVQIHPYSSDLFSYYTSFTDKSLVNWLNQVGSKSEVSTLRSKFLPQFQKIMQKDASWYPDESQLPYIKGTWFEHYLGEWLMNTIPDIDIYIGVKIQNPNTENELDLVFCHRNVLYVMEAKTSITLSGLTDFLYKLDSLGKKFGLYPRSCIAIASKKSENDLLRNTYAIERAKELKIPIFTHKHLCPETIQSTILKWIDS